jgi:hypothetical protein
MRVLALVIAALCGLPAAAQVTAAAGVVLPIGPFARTAPGTDDGFATPGFAARIFLDAPFAAEGTRGLAFTGSLSLFAFPTDEASYSPFPEEGQASEGLGAESEVGAWVIVPVMGGLRYEWAGVNRDVALIGSVQGGVGVVSMPSVRYEEQATSRLLTREASLEATVAGSAGVAIALFDRLELGIHFFGLLPPTFTVEETETLQGGRPDTEDVELTRSIAGTAFTLGYRF